MLGYIVFYLDAKLQQTVKFTLRVLDRFLIIYFHFYLRFVYTCDKRSEGSCTKNDSIINFDNLNMSIMSTCVNKTILVYFNTTFYTFTKSWALCKRFVYKRGDEDTSICISSINFIILAFVSV